MKEELEQPLSLSSRKRRIAAFLIDHFVMTFLLVSLTFMVLGPNLENFDITSVTITPYVIFMFPWFLLYFVKDSVKGISLGKWIIGITNHNSHNPFP